MADMYDAGVIVKFIVPPGEAERVKKIVEAALSRTPIGMMRGMAALLPGGAGKVLGGAAVGGALVMSSPMLQNTLNRLIQTVSLLFRPIGDIVAVGLRPIIDILRPVGMFFRILIQPYIRKATEAMRLGRQFAAAGEYGKAGEAYAVGAAFLLKPFFDTMVTIMTIGVQGVLAGIKTLGLALLWVLDPLNLVKGSFADTMDSVIVSVGEGGARIIRDTELMLYGWLTSLKIYYVQMDRETTTHMDAMNILVGEGFIRMIETATKFFAPSKESYIGQLMDSIIIYGEKKVAEMDAILKREQDRAAASRAAAEAVSQRIVTSTATKSYWNIKEGTAMNPWEILYYETKKGYQQGISYVPKTGPYILHVGEQVVSQPKTSASKTVIYQPTFTIAEATISSEVDMDDIIRRASRQVETDMRRVGLI